MQPRYPHPALSFALLVLIALLASGCGPTPPIAYQQLQVQDMEEAEGYDVYMYVAVNREDLTESQVRSLLEWFRDVKFPEVTTMRIFIWDNPQAALVGSTGDLVGSIHVDRDNDIDTIEIPTRTR